MLAPIILFTYNRPVHLQKTLASLIDNHLADQSELYVFSDGSKSEFDQKKVIDVRSILDQISGFKKVEVFKRNKNFGLSENIIKGVTEVICDKGKVIVLEDDLITSPYFLKFMNNALDLYENDPHIAQVVGYSYYQKFEKKYNLQDGILIRGADCLGWGTWKIAWDTFNPNGNELIEQLEKQNLVTEFNFDNSYNYFQMLKNQRDGLTNSWAIRWMASAFLKNTYTYYPSKSLVYHIGNDAQASNYYNFKNDPLDVPLTQDEVKPKRIILSDKNLYKFRLVHKKYLKEFSNRGPSLLKRVVFKILRSFK
jgi:hypothetical protein